jgi:hypothetical protein
MNNIVTREQIIERAKTIRAEAQQIITDCEHWNAQVRKPHESVINPDPDGQLAKIIAGIDRGLSREDSLRALKIVVDPEPETPL